LPSHQARTPAQRFRRAWRAGPHPARLGTDGGGNLERAGVPRSVAMKMVGHNTESVYKTLRDRRRGNAPRCRSEARRTSRAKSWAKWADEHRAGIGEGRESAELLGAVWIDVIDRG